MFIETIPNRSSPPAVLLREAYRDEHGRAQKRTLANLSKLPVDLIGGLKVLLKGGTVIGAGPDEIQIGRSLPHGHVAAALGMIRKIALDRLILSTTKDQPSRRHCDLVVAMIVDRLIAPRSKLGFVRAVDQETAISSLGSILRLGKVKEREAYEALTEPSEAAKAKKSTKRSADGHHVMSFDALIAHLGTLVRNTMRVPLHTKHRFTLHSRPTSLQEAAFKLLELDPLRVQ